jgi:type III secretion protein W
MADPAGLNSVQALQQAARNEAKELIAEQMESRESAEEEYSEAFNPQAADREQARKNRARPLENRRKENVGEVIKIKQVEGKGQEDVANRFSQRNSELPKDQLLDLRGRLNEQQTAEEILEEVESFFKDPSLQDEALEFLEEVTEGKLKEKVISARKLLSEMKGREVIAGRNIDASAKSFSEKGIGSSTELRDLYRDVTGNPKEHNAMFIELSGRYTYDDLKQVVNFLLQGMGYDLKSKGPSIQEAELQMLMKELKNLQSILWVYLFFKKRLRLMRSMYKKYGMEAEEEDFDFEEIAKNFMQVVEDRYPSVLKILKQAEKMGLTQLEEKIVLLTQYRDATRQLSPRLYKSLKHKQDLVTALLEALEELDEQLEQEYEENEDKLNEK